MAHELTRLLERWSEEGAAAEEELFQAVYGELRQVARSLLARGRLDSVSPSTLVHETYLRLSKGGAPRFSSRKHFFGAAILAMRRLLVEEARRRGASKRGHHQPLLTLGAAAAMGVEPAHRDLDLLRSLSRLREQDPRKATVVELRYLVGCQVTEIASVLEVSYATVKRDLLFATAWLRRDLVAARAGDVGTGGPAEVL